MRQLPALDPATSADIATGVRNASDPLSLLPRRGVAPAPTVCSAGPTLAPTERRTAHLGAAEPTGAR